MGARLALETGTYAAAQARLGSRDSVGIGHNTTLHRVGYGTDGYAVRYHSTDILTMTADGWAEMSTGGWHTVTTWSRINALLPGPWRVGSRNGTPYLWHAGRPVTPYADGLSVHADTGAVGMGSDVLLTADDVAAIMAAYDAAAAIRAEKRCARLLREHPTAGGPRTHTRARWDRRPWDCGRCTAEQRAETDARRAISAGARV